MKRRRDAVGIGGAQRPKLRDLAFDAFRIARNALSTLG